MEVLDHLLEDLTSEDMLSAWVDRETSFKAGREMGIRGACVNMTTASQIKCSLAITQTTTGRSVGKNIAK
jgi:hypothetical protein